MGSLAELTIPKDNRNYPAVTQAVNAGGYVDCRVLAASTAEVQNVPAGAKKVLISATGNSFVQFGGAAAVPAADVTNGSSPVLIVNAVPRMFACEGVATIGVISSAINTVTFEFFK